MSWQDYVDNQLIASQCVSKACIAGHDGGVWAKSDGFEVSFLSFRFFLPLIVKSRKFRISSSSSSTANLSNSYSDWVIRHRINSETLCVGDSSIASRQAPAKSHRRSDESTFASSPRFFSLLWLALSPLRLRLRLDWVCQIFPTFPSRSHRLDDTWTNLLALSVTSGRWFRRVRWVARDAGHSRL